MLAMVEGHSPANVQFLHTVLTHARKVVQYPSTLYVLFFYSHTIARGDCGVSSQT